MFDVKRLKKAERLAKSGLSSAEDVLWLAQFARESMAAVADLVGAAISPSVTEEEDGRLIVRYPFSARPTLWELGAVMRWRPKSEEERAVGQRRRLWTFSTSPQCIECETLAEGSFVESFYGPGPRALKRGKLGLRGKIQERPGLGKAHVRKALRLAEDLAGALGETDLECSIAQLAFLWAAGHAERAEVALSTLAGKVLEESGGFHVEPLAPSDDPTREAPEDPEEWAPMPDDAPLRCQECDWRGSLVEALPSGDCPKCAGQTEPL